MITLRAIPSARKSRAAVSLKLWCQRLNCGRILLVLSDGTFLLCMEKYGHAPSACRHTISRRSA
jgi:hypothetical protein